jgi:hypothetical protein
MRVRGRVRAQDLGRVSDDFALYVPRVDTAVTDRI